MMSNYPDDFDAAAHNARYAQADCLVDDWRKTPVAMALAKSGAIFTNEGEDDLYRHAISVLNEKREQAFDDCRCGRCADSNNWATDGASLINDAMVSA
jgi:hypothetical protein